MKKYGLKTLFKNISLTLSGKNSPQGSRNFLMSSMRTLKGWVWPGMSKNRYSVVSHYTNNLVFAPGLLKELQSRSPKNEKGHRGNRLHQWLTEEVGDPMLAQHLHSLMMFQRLAIANGFGWQRFLHMVDQVFPRRGATLELPLEFTGKYDAAN
jgi:hypothetical protein